MNQPADFARVHSISAGNTASSVGHRSARPHLSAGRNPHRRLFPLSRRRVRSRRLLVRSSPGCLMLRNPPRRPLCSYSPSPLLPSSPRGECLEDATSQPRGSSGGKRARIARGEVNRAPFEVACITARTSAGNFDAGVRAEGIGCGTPRSHCWSVADFCQTVTRRKIAGPPPGTTPIVSVPLSRPGEAAFSAPPNKTFPLAVPSSGSPHPASRHEGNLVTIHPLNRALAIVPPRPEEKAWRTRPLNVAPLQRADQLGSSDGKPGKPSASLLASLPVPASVTSAQVFPPKDLTVETPRVPAGQLGKTVAVLMSRNAALSEIAGVPPEATPTVYAPPSLPVSGDVVSPARSKKPLPFILLGGIAGLLLAISTLAGWYLFHRKAQGAPVSNVPAQPVQPPAPLVEIAAPTLEAVDTPAPAPEQPEVRSKAPAPAKKPHRVKAVTAANPAPAVPAADPKTAELVRLQNLALDACAKGNYAEPRDANAIAYSQQALALDPSNGLHTDDSRKQHQGRRVPGPPSDLEQGLHDRASPR